MRKFLISLFLFCLFFSCQKEKNKGNLAVKKESVTSQSSSESFDFEDKEKKESCDNEEDIEKELEKAKKSQEAFSLQGSDSGCEVK